MFLEKDTNSKTRSGWIEVICGSMFSGKTEELIRRLNRARIAKQRVEIFKPHIDKRYSEEDVVSHDSKVIQSIPVESASQILFYAGEMEVIGIDEAQFFDDELASVCDQLANSGIRVIIAGLDMDFQGKPFGPLPALMATAEYVTKVHAICMRCGNLANYSHRIIANEKLVMLGETESYEPLCRKCFNESRKQKG
jgi:thymidine kinase